MTIKFAILNPNNGSYIYANSAQAALQTLASAAIGFYMAHAHNQLFSFVQVQEDGSEKWFSSSGEPIPSAQDIEAALIAEINARTENRIYGEIPITVVS